MKMSSPFWTWILRCHWIKNGQLKETLYPHSIGAVWAGSVWPDWSFDIWPVFTGDCSGHTNLSPSLVRVNRFWHGVCCLFGG